MEGTHQRKAWGWLTCWGVDYTIQYIEQSRVALLKVSKGMDLASGVDTEEEEGRKGRKRLKSFAWSSEQQQEWAQRQTLTNSIN